MCLRRYAVGADIVLGTLTSECRGFPPNVCTLEWSASCVPPGVYRYCLEITRDSVRIMLANLDGNVLVGRRITPAGPIRQSRATFGDLRRFCVSLALYDEGANAAGAVCAFRIALALFSL